MLSHLQICLRQYLSLSLENASLVWHTKPHHICSHFKSHISYFLFFSLFRGVSHLMLSFLFEPPFLFHMFIFHDFTFSYLSYQISHFFDQNCSSCIFIVMFILSNSSLTDSHVHESSRSCLIRYCFVFIQIFEDQPPLSCKRPSEPAVQHLCADYPSALLLHYRLMAVLFLQRAALYHAVC